MGRKCFISFKTEDAYYKNFIQAYLAVDMVDRSLDTPINSNDHNYIMRVIREQYLSDSTVTIHLIGARSAENLGSDEQRFIKSELQASLFHGESNTQNGILGVVLPEVLHRVYGGLMTCPNCGSSYTYVGINDSTVVREFSLNYYIPHSVSHKCSWAEDERFCVLVPWSDFIATPEAYIEQSYLKRFAAIANRTIVRP